MLKKSIYNFSLLHINLGPRNDGEITQHTKNKLDNEKIGVVYIYCKYRNTYTK